MSANGRAMATPDPAQVLRWPGRVLAAADLQRHLNGHRAVVLGPQTVITPLAGEELRQPFSQFTASLVDAPRASFTLDGAAIGRRGASASFGLTTALGGRLLLSGEYNALFEMGERAHSVSIGLAF